MGGGYKERMRATRVPIANSSQRKIVDTSHQMPAHIRNPKAGAILKRACDYLLQIQKQRPRTRLGGERQEDRHKLENGKT